MQQAKKPSVETAALKEQVRYTNRNMRIYDALAFLTKTLFILGYSGFYKKGLRYESTKGMLVYNIVMPLCVVIVLMLGTYRKVTNPQDLQAFRDMDRLLMSIVMLEIVMASLSFIVNVASMNRNRWRHIHIIDHIDQLDAHLVREFDVRMCYEKIAYKTTLIQVVFFVYDIVVTFSVISHWGLGDLAIVIGIIFCYSMILAGMHMSTYAFMNVADLVRIRFRLLEKLLAPEYLRKHFADEEVRASKLRQAIEIYRGLYEVIDELNGVYGMCMLSCMAHDFTLTTSQLYLMFGRSSNLGSIKNLRVFIGVLASLLPPAYRMVMMPVYSTMSMEEGKKCMRAIKLMDDAFPGDGRVRQIVGAALLWNNHNKVEYKIGPITSNVGMMAAVISALVNYVVIMIQFQIQEEVLNKEKEKRRVF